MGTSRSESRESAFSWARVTLRVGRSAGGTWEVDGRYPEARLILGASPGVGWPIEGLGVRPAHCELYWDGRSLWVNDPAGLDDVWLDGLPVVSWTQVEGPASLTFGEAALDLETAAVEPRSLRTDPARAWPVTVPASPLQDASASVLDALVMLDSVESNDMTRIDVRPEDLRAAAELQAGDDRWSSLDDLPRDGSAMHPGAMQPSEERRLAGGRASGEPAAACGAAKRTREVDGAAPRPGGTFPTRPSGEQRAHSLCFDPSDPTEARPIRRSDPAKDHRWPTRTWVMLGLTALAAAGVLLWDSAAPTPDAPSPAEEGPVTPPMQRTAKEEPVVPPAVMPSAVTPAGAPGGAGPMLQRVAIEHFDAGRLGHALAAYRALATLHPEQEAYGTMVQILERQLARAGPAGDESCR